MTVGEGRIRRTREYKAASRKVARVVRDNYATELEKAGPIRRLLLRTRMRREIHFRAERLALYLDPRFHERWEVGLMKLIRDRYRCDSAHAAQIRERFSDWEVEAAGIRVEMGSDDRPILEEDVLAVLDHCAYPERAGQAAQRAAEELRRSNQQARALAATLTSDGLTCPHCRRHRKDVRFVEPSRSERLYFICRACGGSFVPADLEQPG